MKENNGLMAGIVERKIEKPPLEVSFPEVIGLFPLNEGIKLKDVPEMINRLIIQLVDSMILEMGGKDPNLQEMIGDYKVILNKKGTLSIRFENFSFIEMQAHPSTIVRSLTVDLITANVYQLHDLFKINSNYRLVINEEIKRQIKEREIDTIQDFVRINDDQAFYLTDRDLVIYFQEAELAPRVWGIVEFPISYNILVNVIDKAGPLGRLLG